MSYNYNGNTFPDELVFSYPDELIDKHKDPAPRKKLALREIQKSEEKKLEFFLLQCSKQRITSGFSFFIKSL